MNLHLKELGITIIFSGAMGVALLSGLGEPLAIVISIILLVFVSRLLSLRLRTNSRERYYLIGPAFFYFSGLLAVSGLRHSPLSLLMLPAFALLSYGLLRSLVVRRQEPMAQVALYQNIFLSTIWISLFLATLSLYNLLSQPVEGLILFVILVPTVVFLLTQGLFHYVRIAPWAVRSESALAAWGIFQTMIIFSLWTVSPLTVAGCAFLLLYLFWGLIYHSHTQRLTRKILYEYLLMSSLGLGFLLAVTSFSPAL